jgi:hypothetical protein
MANQGEFTSGSVLTSTELNTFSQVTLLEDSFTIPSNTNYTLDYGLGTEIIDVGDWHSETTNPSRITVPYEGIYVINFSVYDLLSTNRALLNVYKNAGIIGSFDSAVGEAHNDFTFTKYERANANDYFSGVMYQNSGVDKDADISFAVHLVRRIS